MVQAVTDIAPVADDRLQLQLLIDHVSDHAIYMLDAQGCIRSWNRGCERVKGYTAEEACGQHVGLFYGAEDRAQQVPQQTLAQVEAQGRFVGEGWRVRRSGERFRASEVIEAVRHADGTLLGFVKVTQDITERYQAQRLLQDAQRAREQLQQFEGVGRLTRGLAHEFNNLLTTIGTALDLIAAQPTAGARTRELTELAQAAADRGSLLTRQLLAFSADQTLIREPLQVAQLLQDELPSLQRACPPNILLRTEVPFDLPRIATDGVQLHTAVLNLLLNSCEAMPQGGTVTLSARVEQRLAPDLATPTQRRYVAIAVTDVGSGMPPDVAERASEPFFTTKEVGKGSGLGLSQVFGFVSQCDGFVDVQTALGRGTTVRLLLPALEESAHV
ncbi:PAS domain S-box protein [uncultured Stenotrophomonas sp.]|uniref:two-component system sensor histidine kinase NtrB n=1 Tax=uncultured Stenotrophomonas sp. TaxID=165438 RepID=UPI0028F13159|nr:PAS domain S-box protein [uncultured Stenotrophomonas sp.]